MTARDLMSKLAQSREGALERAAGLPVCLQRRVDANLCVHSPARCVLRNPWPCAAVEEGAVAPNPINNSAPLSPGATPGSPSVNGVPGAPGTAPRKRSIASEFGFNMFTSGIRLGWQTELYSRKFRQVRRRRKQLPRARHASMRHRA